MRKYDKMNARLGFSPKYCRVVAEKSIKPLVSMYHVAMSMFLGSKNALNVVCFCRPPSHILMEVLPGK